MSTPNILNHTEEKINAESKSNPLDLQTTSQFHERILIPLHRVYGAKYELFRLCINIHTESIQDVEQWKKLTHQRREKKTLFNVERG